MDSLQVADQIKPRSSILHTILSSVIFIYYDHRPGHGRV